jgi:hypothetical protein
MGPLLQGGSAENGAFIVKTIETMEALYPGRALCVNNEGSAADCLDGLLLHCVPETSKQIGFGFLPDPVITLRNKDYKLLIYYTD